MTKSDGEATQEFHSDDHDSKDGHCHDHKENTGLAWLCNGYIIEDDSRLWVFWDPLILLLCTISSYAYAWYAAFGDDIFVEGNSNIYHILTLESFFTLEIILNFVRAYRPNGHNIETVRSHRKIADRYWKGNFKFDFIMWIPFWIYFDNQSYWRVLFAIKVFRLNRVVEQTNTSDVL